MCFWVLLVGWYCDCGGFVGWVALFGYSFVNNVDYYSSLLWVYCGFGVVVCLCVVSVVCGCSCLLALFGLLVLVFC